ncbi:MAG: transaldolase, partial [Acetobacteraceae bacterium]|nr:transaldolase [Acetobacteraceae bacterium]
MNPLKQLEQCGQSPWLDYVRRGLIQRGELQTLIERDGLKGMTSNPAIFEKAIAESDNYLNDLKQFLSKADHGISETYDYLSIGDIKAAADALRPVFDATRRRDGYISLEVSPYIANDTEATLSEARRLAAAVDRENLMIKVPGTKAGIPAIRQLISEGRNINVTLLFGIPAYEQVVEAYLAGLEELVQRGGDPSRVASVASFFVSRIDSLVDKKLDALGDKAVADRLRGKAAIANAKMAYQRYQAQFSGPRWEKLAANGAQTQRLLWASTSTKNPAYRDTIYVEELIGRDTVNTMPPATMDAFRDHGIVRPDMVKQGLDEAHAAVEELARHGIRLPEVADTLVEQGVELFADPFDKLLEVVAKRRREVLGGRIATLSIGYGDDRLKEEYGKEAELWRKEGRIRRLWKGDKSLWTGADEDRWVGWLRIVAEEPSSAGELERFAEEVR